MERNYYALVARGATWEHVDDPLGDQVERFEEHIGLRENPEALAMEMHKMLLASRGIEWDDTPVKGSGSGQWWDQDIDDFRDMSQLDAGGSKGQPGKHG